VGFVTPRERAEALGWVRSRDAGGIYWHVWLPHAAVGIGPLVWEYAPGRWSVLVDHRARPDTEDEALAHALLLRDVVLS
jgi:hypothetical protein